MVPNLFELVRTLPQGSELVRTSSATLGCQLVELVCYSQFIGMNTIFLERRKQLFML